jgi:hypothetical protein
VHGTDIRTASIIFTNTQKSPNSINHGAIRGLFYSLKAQSLSPFRPSRNRPSGHRYIYHERYSFQCADQATLRAIDYIKNASVIKAIVAGHTHMNYEETFENGLVQIVMGANDKYIREITVC